MGLHGIFTSKFANRMLEFYIGDHEATPMAEYSTLSIALSSIRTASVLKQDDKNILSDIAQD